MKRIYKLLLIIILTISFKANADVRPIDIHGKLSVSGTNIVDKNNNKFQLRGISTHGIAWFPGYVNQDAFNYMRDEWNINVIRLAMYSDPNAGYSKDVVNKVKQGVEYARNSGLYVIIDWHILNDNNPNQYKSEAINFFKEMASLYKDYDNIIYEICNEPNGNVTWDRDIKPYAEDVIKEIRNIDNDAIIVVGTPTWSQDVDIVSNNPIKGYSNIMYTLHFYADTHRDNIRNKLKTALNNGLPVFVTEFGICDASGNGNVNIDEGNKWLNLLDDNNISYIIWNLSNKNESSSIIKSDVNKTTGWKDNELSTQGSWFIKHLKSFDKEVVEVPQEEIKEEPTTTIAKTNEEVNESGGHEVIQSHTTVKIVIYFVLGFFIGGAMMYVIKKMQKR